MSDHHHLSQPGLQRRDGDPKRKIKYLIFLKILEKESRHYSLLSKLWKNRKLRLWSMKSDLESWTRLRVEKVLAPHNVRPKTVPLIK